MSGSALAPAAKRWGAVAAVLCSFGLVRAGDTSLDRYVAKPDPTYSWKIDQRPRPNGHSIRRRPQVADLADARRTSIGPSGSTG